jgi:hypothetical protein
MPVKEEEEEEEELYKGHSNENQKNYIKRFTEKADIAVRL